MKKTFLLYTFIFLSSLVFSSCEDTIIVDLETSKPRLVIDAALKWQKGTDGHFQKIKISRTRGFYENTPVPVTDALVSLSNENNQNFTFTDTNGDGVYSTNNFEPQIDQEYTLKVNVDDRNFKATEKLKPVSQIDSVQQKDDGGFSGENIEIKVFYKDPAAFKNFYLYTFDVDFLAYPVFSILNDDFNNGNAIFAYYTEEDLEAGDTLKIKAHGISETYYNYLEVLLDQTGAAGGPFQTQPATVRGNIVDQDNPEDYIFGYFSLSETDQLNYEVK
ncbi:MAG: DUF4249 domain-containing protein [Psychroflexus sp.]|nr:DUF4249 domain-containing protein [Psychroflexus sp.]MDN6309902.1 DUF4249 domain-containing protein [Psychroflexus sp.]